MATLHELQARLQKLEDTEAIRRLKERYALLADERYGKSRHEKEAIVAELVQLFTEDAVWDGGAVAKVRGRQQIHELFLEPRHKFAIHYFKMTDLRIEGDRASASWIYFMPATKFDDTAVWQAGREDEEYVKLGGKWLIGSLKMTLFFHTSYHEGWARQRVLAYN